MRATGLRGRETLTFASRIDRTRYRSSSDGGLMRHPFLRFIVACALMVARPAFAQSATLIIVNARVHTVNTAKPNAEAIAIADGRIVAVGSTREIRALAGAKTEVLDARGNTIIPGLQDNHLHGAGGGPGVDLSGARTMADLLARIAARVKTTRGDVVFTNADWHEAQLQEQRVPTRADLDAIAPSTPVVVVRGGHEYILNSAALAKWNITRTTPEPAGGRISRGADGDLNGELVDRAKDLVTLPGGDEPSAPTVESMAAEFHKLNASGLTSIRIPGGSVEQYRLLQEMKRRGVLTMRVNHLLRIPAQTPAQLKAALDATGVRPDEGDEWVRNGGIKLLVDGGFEGGWMSEPYEEPFGKGGRYTGLNVVPLGAFTALVKEANRAGWRVATHAVGDAAIDEVLTAYEAADAERSIKGRRWSIEHAFLPREEHFARMKALELTISVQDHLYLAGPSLVKMWGAKRAAWVTPMRAFLDHGIEVSGGTDSPVIPYNPLWVYYHWVTRRTMTGGVLGADQRITRAEALRVETLNNAYLTFEEKTKGSIEVGKFADLVMLPKDLLTMPEEDIPGMRVLMTMVGGKIVYRRE
jgi:predicted amidohydrolase YtcJ